MEFVVRKNEEVLDAEDDVEIQNERKSVTIPPVSPQAAGSQEVFTKSETNEKDGRSADFVKMSQCKHVQEIQYRCICR